MDITGGEGGVFERKESELLRCFLYISEIWKSRTKQGVLTEKGKNGINIIFYLPF